MIHSDAEPRGGRLRIFQAGGGRDHLRPVVGHPVRRVRVVERDARRLGQGENRTGPPTVGRLDAHGAPALEAYPVDPAGKRAKDSFLENIRGMITLKKAAVGRNARNDAEDLFQLFSEISAPDVSAFNQAYDDRARRNSSGARPSWRPPGLWS